MKPLEVGDRVKINSVMYEGEGTVFYTDNPNLFNHDFMPIQVELDKPDGDGHSMMRFSLREVKPI